MERSFLYKSGDLFLPDDAKRFLQTYIIGNDSSIYYINYWSLIHLLSGVVMHHLVGDKAIFSLVVHTLWELWQIYIGMTKINARGIIDSINDTLFFMIGFYISRIYRKYQKS
jgi:hypothetical protein